MRGKRGIKQAVKVLVVMSVLLGVFGTALAKQSRSVSEMPINHGNAVIAAAAMLLLGLLVFFFRHKMQG